MSKVVIASMFRDSQNWCGFEINQVDLYMRRWLPQGCDLYLLEGDSKDDTYEQLQFWAEGIGEPDVNINLFKHDKQSQFEGSVDTPSRMKNLANSANFLLSQIPLQKRLVDDELPEYVLWIESDIIAPLDYVANMVKYMESSDFDVLSSMSWVNVNKMETVFYDTWAFTDMTDVNYGNFSYDRFYGTKDRPPMLEMKSIGTTALIKTDVLRAGVNFGDGAFRQLCEDARTAGFKVGTVTEKDVNVYHPSTYGLIKNRWI